MQYNAPYGVSDPNAPYINGNPSTGTMGSIPPAASIEYPQREIVNFITKSNWIPDNADLFQLGKSVQGGVVNYGTDVGAVNRIAITPSIPLTAYALGQRFIVKMTYANTSTVQVNISNIGWVPLVHCDLSPINAWELLAGQLIEIAFDGTNFQMLSGGAPGAAVVMTAPRDVYVSDSIGNDNFDGTSSAISGTNTGPYKTIQKALATSQKYNLGGWSFNIHVADGTYNTATAIALPVPNGSGFVHLIGNLTSPSQCKIHNTGAGSCYISLGAGQFVIEGFAYQTTAATGGDPGCGIYFADGGMLWGGTASYGPVSGDHVRIGPSASALIGGTQYITGGAPNGCHLTGTINGTNLIDFGGAGVVDLVIQAAATFNAFASAGNGGQVRAIYKSITGAANVTGQKYLAVANGVIDSGGRGASYLPGTVAGSLATGGQYV